MTSSDDPQGAKMMPSVGYRALAIAGIILVIISLAADWIGIGSPGFAREQSIILAAGLLAICWGLLGSRFIGLYKTMALNLLNLFVLLFCLEVGSTIIVRARQLWPSAEKSASLADQEQLPRPAHAGFPVPFLINYSYYSSQEWGDSYWRDLNLAIRTKHYRPWLQWDYGPLKESTINVDERGIRLTPESECQADSYKIFTFGGSTMWGIGAPDWGTIPAYLQSEFQKMSARPICVVNFGEIAYVSTQNVIQLLLQLQSGNVPDLVIFYDGIADVIASFESGVPGEHIEIDEATARFDVECPLVNQPRLFGLSNLYRLLQSWVGRRQPERRNYLTRGGDTESVAKSTAGTYLANYELMGALSREHDFDYLFFWQPISSYGSKPLTSEEQPVASQLSDEFVELTEAVYSEVQRSTDLHDKLYFIADVFDDVPGEIWIDMFHVNPDGNRLVANAMLEAIRQDPPLMARLRGGPSENGGPGR